MFSPQSRTVLARRPPGSSTRSRLPGGMPGPSSATENPSAERERDGDVRAAVFDRVPKGSRTDCGSDSSRRKEPGGLDANRRVRSRHVLPAVVGDRAELDRLDVVDLVPAADHR